MRSKSLATAALALLSGAVVVSDAAGRSGLSAHRCAGADSGTYGTVFVASGETCTFTGTAGDLSVQAGGTLTLTGAHIRHNLTARQAAAIAVGSATRIDHDATVRGTVGSVNVSGSTIGHNATFQNNNGLVLSGDSIGHDLAL